VRVYLLIRPFDILRQEVEKEKLDEVVVEKLIEIMKEKHKINISDS
jgi:hypothetical protein